MNYSKLGEYIKKERLKLGVSLNEFSIVNDIDPAILSRIENLKQDIKLNVLRKISNGFKKSPGEFLMDFENQ